MNDTELNQMLTAHTKEIRTISEDVAAWYFAFTGYSHLLVASLRDHETTPDNNELYWSERTAESIRRLEDFVERYAQFVADGRTLIHESAAFSTADQERYVQDTAADFEANGGHIDGWRAALRKGKAASHDIIGQDPHGHAFAGMAAELVSTEDQMLRFFLQTRTAASSDGLFTTLIKAMAVSAGRAR